MKGYAVHSTGIYAETGYVLADTSYREVHEYFETLDEAMDFVLRFRRSSLPPMITSHGITLYCAQWTDVASWENERIPEEVSPIMEKPEILDYADFSIYKVPVTQHELLTTIADMDRKDKPELPGQAWCNPHNCHPSMCWDKHNPKYLS